jgi:hypothetical protein
LDAFSSVVTLLLAHPDSNTSIAAQTSPGHASAPSRTVEQEFNAPISECLALGAAISRGKLSAMFRMSFPASAWLC